MAGASTEIIYASESTVPWAARQNRRVQGFRRTLNDRTAAANNGPQPKENRMNVAKWLLLGVLALPVAELSLFAAVAAATGLLWAAVLVAGTSLVGAMILRHAHGNHIGRIRVAMADGSFSALQADSLGAGTLVAGLFLIIPGFITDAIGVLLLLRSLAATVRRGGPQTAPDGVLDLDPGQWQRNPHSPMPDRSDSHGR